MKILQLNVTANWGSTGKITEGIGLAAIRKGWESYIAYGRDHNPSQSKTIKVGSQFDVYKHYIQSKLFDSEGFGSLKSTKRLIKQIENVCPDIIHLHNIHDHWLNYPVLFNYFSSIDTPIIWTFHDCWAFTGGCFHFDNVGCYQWRNELCSGKCPLFHPQSSRNFQIRKQVFNRLQERLHIVSVSDWLANYVRQSFFSESQTTITVIRNGIDTQTIFRPSTRKKKNLVLGVSNIWTIDKGIEDFYALREFIPSDTKFLLVGLSKKQIKALPEGLEGIERTNDSKELAALYQDASVFVNPSYNDSFPTVNLEALACGTPVITYRTGGSPEAVDKNTGLVVNKGDINGLANGIMHILNHPDEFSSEACRNRALKLFNKDIQFNKYIDLYESLLNK